MDMYFDHIYIINLPSRTDRRVEMEIQLRRAQVMTGQFFDAFQFAQAEPFHRVGSRGSYMSHLAVLKKSIGARNVCTLQDDVNFSRDFKTRSRIISTLPTDWAMFYGGYRLLNPSTRIEFRDKLSRLDPSQELIGAHFFAVNGSVINKLVAAMEAFLTRPRGSPDGGPMPIDGALNMFRRQNPELPVYAVYPPLGYQRSSRSDCGTLNWFDRTPFISTAVAHLRKVKNALRR